MRTRLHGGYCLNIEYMPNIVYNRQMKGAEFMAERLASLSVYNYIYAALIAFVVTYLILRKILKAETNWQWITAISTETP